MFETTQLNRKNLARQKLFQIALGSMTGLLILPVILILGTLIYKGAPVISFEFLFTSPTNGMTAGGIFPALLGTVLLVVVALLASVPLGVAAAIYLSEYAPDNMLPSEFSRSFTSSHNAARVRQRSTIISSSALFFCPPRRGDKATLS